MSVVSGPEGTEDHRAGLVEDDERVRLEIEVLVDSAVNGVDSHGKRHLVEVGELLRSRAHFVLGLGLR